MPNPVDGARPLRRDAQRNREALLAAARQVFGERGVDAPLEAVAAQAGLAIGTLYRHFPTRAALLHIIIGEKLLSLLDIGRRALATPDPWDAFVSFVEQLSHGLTQDKALNHIACDAVLHPTRPTSPEPTSPEPTPPEPNADPAGAEVYEMMVAVIARAQQAGALRADFTLTDLALLTQAIAHVGEVTAVMRPTLWRRYLEMSLDALRAEHAHPLAEPPLADDELTLR